MLEWKKNRMECFPNSDFYNAVKIMSDVSNGLQVLHSRTPAIVHGDLHLGNVLLIGAAASLKAKIADFSNSKIVTALYGASGRNTPK